MNLLLEYYGQHVHPLVHSYFTVTRYPSAQSCYAIVTFVQFNIYRSEMYGSPAKRHYRICTFNAIYEASILDRNLRGTKRV